MDERTNKAPETGWNGPVRRVGSLTLGVCLIAAGVLFLCYFFLPGFDWQLAVKIAPAAGLILLGCEVLYFAAKPRRWKYDFLSVLLCLVLMTACFGASCLMMAFDYYTKEQEAYWQSEGAQPRWEESDARLREDLDNGTGPDLEEENPVPGLRETAGRKL